MSVNRNVTVPAGSSRIGGLGAYDPAPQTVQCSWAWGRNADPPITLTQKGSARFGPKTGKARRKCIRVIRKGNKAYLVQLRPPEIARTDPAVVAAWVRNIRANPDVQLRIRGGAFRGVARELKEPGELELARVAICETVTLTDYGECILHLRGFPTRAKIQELHRYWLETGVPLVIELRD